MNKDNRWTRFASQVSFKGMTVNNRAVLNYVAHHHHSTGCVLSFRQIGSYVGITKQSARRNIRVMESFGVIKSRNQYGGGYKDTLPLIFKINLDWKESNDDTHI